MVFFAYSVNPDGGPHWGYSSHSPAFMEFRVLSAWEWGSGDRLGLQSWPHHSLTGQPWPSNFSES